MIGSALVLGSILATPSSVGQESEPSAATRSGASATAPGAEEPAVRLRFEGLLPGCVDPELAGTFRVDFALYRSPQGGEAIWTESLDVRVERGRMDVEFGRRNRIPLALHEETFKFLGASVNGAREVYPRFAVVNVVFVSPDEALLAARGRDGAIGTSQDGGRGYDRPRMDVSSSAEAASTWREALLLARAAGAELPDYEDWYASLAAADSASALARAGHYEWVMPWVYDPASHGRYHAYFRGRFQGCDYMDLSPDNRYAYRLSFPRKEDSSR